MSSIWNPCAPTDLRALLASIIGASLIGEASGINVQQKLDILYYGIANVRDPKYEGGAKGDDVHNDSFAFQACMNDCEATRKLMLVPQSMGAYRLNQQITKSPSFTCPNIQGQGSAFTQIKYYGEGAAFSITGGSGSAANAIISGIKFDGNGTNRGLEFRSQNGITVRDCQFDNVRIAGLLNNVAGGFTEYVQFSNCIFRVGCDQSLVYARNGGTDSFHGSGLLPGCVVEERTGATHSPIEIGGEFSANQNVFVYNAPLSLQWFKNTVGTSLITNNSTRPCQNFFGHLTIENFVAGGGNFPLVTSPTSQVLFYVGDMTELTKSATRGAMYFAYNFASNASGVFIGVLKPYKLVSNMVLAQGANALGALYFTGGEAYKIVAVLTDTTSPAQKVMEFTAFGGNVYAVGGGVTVVDYFGGNFTTPTFSLSGTNLSVTCDATFTAGRINCNVTVTQIANSFLSII